MRNPKSISRLFVFSAGRSLLAAVAALSILGALCACANDRLIGRSILPAMTFAPGPTSGQQLGTNPVNGVIPPFLNNEFIVIELDLPLGTPGR